MKTRHILLSILLNLLPNSLYAQYEAISQRKDFLQFNHLKEDIGMANMVVNQIYEDKDGFIWFSTETGLCKFDGHQVEYLQYGSEARNKTLANTCAFYTDDSGDTWMGNGSRIILYHRQTEDLTDVEYTTDNRLPLPSITALKVYGDDIWMGTEQGLWFAKLEDKLQFQKLDFTTTLAQTSHHITSLLVGPGNHLWAGTQQGLFLVKTDAEGHHELKNIPLKGVEQPQIKALQTYDNCHLLVITSEGLFAVDSKQNAKLILAQSDITAANATSTGEIWCTTFGEGIFHFNSLEEKGTPYKNFNVSNTTFNYINTSFVDSHDNLWIVPEKLGLRWLNHSSQFVTNYTQLHYQEGLNNNIVKDIEVDTEGNWYIATYWGLSVYHPQAKTYEHVSLLKHAKSTNQIESLAFDSTGRLWIGTRDGLYDYHPQTGAISSHPALDGQLVWSISPASDGLGLWLGTDQGLLKMDFDHDRIHSFSPGHAVTPSVAPDQVLTLLEDSHHRLWVGMRKNGLFMAKDIRDANKISFSALRNSETDTGCDASTIYSLFESHDGAIWVGSQNGLFRYLEDGTFEHFADESGKAYNIIKGITEDTKNRLWLTTHLGLICIDRKSKETVNYNTIDGMSSDIFNIGACKMTNGWLLAGSLKGLIAVQTDSLIQEEATNENFYISDIAVNNLPVKVGEQSHDQFATSVAPRYLDKLELQHDENNISISFGNIEINHPQRIRWAYRIVEKEENWQVLPEGEHAITLLNLSKGNYTLEYKSTNANQHWGSQTKTLVIRILPHWSQTLWAYAFYGAMGLLLLIAILNYQKRKIKEKETLEKERALHRQTLALEKDKMEFFTNISHELRTPMTLITAPLYELREKGDQLSKVEKQYYVDLMNKNVQLLDREIEQLLNFSKIQNGMAHLHLGHHQVARIIQRIVSNFQDYAHQKGISISFTDYTTLGNVVCDSHAIEIILCNLISNAIKYSPEGGKVEVDLTLPSEKPGHYCISVKDEGIGIREAQQKDIFKRYARMDNAQHTAGGIGIGLAYTQSLVQLHEGEITVHSQLHQGSCFAVFLPLQLSDSGDVMQPSTVVATAKPVCDAELPLPAISLADPEGKETLLIVEDNTDLQTFLQTLLGHRYRILTANHGKEGWTLACHNLPDLIITDVMMPEMDGIEMTRKLKANYMTSHIPVVMLTAKGEVRDELEGLNAGANFYLKKPFLPRQLELIVKNIQDQQQKMRHHLLSESTVSDDAQQTEKSEVQDKFLQQVTEYIQSHLSSPDLTVENLAEVMNVSSVHLYRKLKQSTDISPNDWIRNLRMKQAVQLLCKKEMNVTDVAYAVGYSDPKYFSKCFKTIYGMSPTAYVKATASKK